jgi:hypothetical protein
MAETYKGVGQADGSKAKSGQLGAMAQSAADQALSAGRDLKDKAVDLAGSSAETIKDHASEFAGAAKDIASQAGDKVQQAVNDQRVVGADYVGNFAGSLRRAAREFEPDIPIAATYIRKAASQVETVSDTVRNGNVKDLVRNAQSFARRQPTAFLGLSVLAGFGVIRFLKSTADAGEPSSDTQSPDSPGSNHARPKPETTWAPDSQGYRDEFIK